MDDSKLEMLDDMKGIVEGEMIIPISKTNGNLGSPDFNTLDEPIRETILRDLKAVGNKFAHVLIPTEKKSLLKEWDLWGPLILCTCMAMILQGSNRNPNSNDGGPEFAQVFVIVWIGSMIVTLNSKLLGGNMMRIVISVINRHISFCSLSSSCKGSFFQSVCVLGYCLLPTAIALITCSIILMAEDTYLLFFLRVTASMVGFGWATYASIIFLGDSQKPGRKALAVYPIFLFYFIISWLVMSHTNE